MTLLFCETFLDIESLYVKTISEIPTFRFSVLHSCITGGLVLLVLADTQIKYTAGTLIKLFTCPNNLIAYFDYDLTLIQMSRVSCLHD